MPDEKEWRPRRKHRRHIYYKVQIFDDTSLTWLDEKSAFDEVASAKRFVAEQCAGRKTRIMVVDGRNRHPLQE